MKGYSTFPKSPRQETHHLLQLCHIRTLAFLFYAVGVFYSPSRLGCTFFCFLKWFLMISIDYRSCILILHTQLKLPCGTYSQAELSTHTQFTNEEKINHYLCFCILTSVLTDTTLWSPAEVMIDNPLLNASYYIIVHFKMPVNEVTKKIPVTSVTTRIWERHLNINYIHRLRPRKSCKKSCSFSLSLSLFLSLSFFSFLITWAKWPNSRDMGLASMIWRKFFSLDLFMI